MSNWQGSYPSASEPSHDPRKPVKGSRIAPNAATLSCELCRQRKVKCDKGSPCLTCQRAGVACIPVHRPRLPRGRNGGRPSGDVELRARVAKLENLVKSLETNGSSESPGVPSEPSLLKLETTSVPPPGNLSRYIGSTFWSTLTAEVNGLREVLDHSSDEESEGSTPRHVVDSAYSNQEQNFNFVLFGPRSFVTNPDLLTHPSRIYVNILCDVYLQNVDPLIKILHAPSIRNCMQKDGPYLNYQPGNAAVEALIFAIYHAAIVSLSQSECLNQLGQDRSALIGKFRFAAEVYLTKADIVNTTDITTLQALVILVTSTRFYDNSRWPWTMTGLIVRVALALNLHLEGAHLSQSSFNQEMRRRLWAQISLLELQSSFDRGTDMVISENDLSSQLPRHINDADISVANGLTATHREEFTDMTFSYVTYEISKGIRRLHHLAFDRGKTTPCTLSWQERQAVIVEVCKAIEDKYVRHCNTSHPFHQFTRAVSRVIYSTSMLYAVRPIMRVPMTTPPPISGPDILQLSVKVLENSLNLFKGNTSEATKPWIWYVWIQWHALAVALAEICTQDDSAAVRHAWDVIEGCYPIYGDFIADSRTGMLWRPIEKLYKKAQERVSARPRNESHTSATNAVTLSQIQRGTESLSHSMTSFSFPSTDVVDGLSVAPPSDPIPWGWEPMNTDMDFAAANIPSAAAWEKWEDFVQEFNGYSAPGAGEFQWQ